MRTFWTNFRAHRSMGLITALMLAWYGLGVQPAIAGGVYSGSGTFASDFVTYIADKTLLLAEKALRMEQLGDKAQLPRRNSTTFQYTRYERLPLPQSTLTEGITPAETAMSITTVTATVQQWGQVVILTDVAELVVKHPVVQKGIKLLALAAAETIDRVIQLILLGGTNVQFANSKSSRANLLATDVLTTTEVTKCVANLRNNGARVYGGNSLGGDDVSGPNAGGQGDGNLYFGVLDPSVEADISADTTWVNAQSYSSIVNLRNFEIGKWKGVRWLLSNFMFTFTGVAAASGADVTTGGAIAQTTQVFFVVSGVNNTTGFEERLYQQTSVTTATDGLSTHRIQVTMPATAGYTYNLYAGLTTGITFLVSTGNLPSAAAFVATVPTSGTTNPAIPGTGITVHTVYVVGEEAFTVVKLDGMSLQTYVTPKGATDSDPIEQRRKIGWKIMFNAVICNQNFLRRIECGSAF